MTIKLAKKVAASYLKNMVGKTSSTMEEAFDNYEDLVDALSSDYEVMSEVIEAMVNMGDLTYRDGSFYYRDNTRLASSYYRASPDLTIEGVVEKWALEGAKIRGEGVHVWLDPKDVWPLREYTWTRDNSRAGVTYVDGKLVDLPGPQKWDALKEDLKKNGWRKDQQPVMVLVGKDGSAKVTEGNHRLAIAREIRMRKVPVQFIFRDSVSGGHQVISLRRDRSRIDEVMDILNNSRR